MTEASEVREESRSEKAKNLLLEMLRMLDVDATVRIEGEEEFKLCIETGDAGRLIGKKGQNLEALELLLNRILKKNDTSSDKAPWVSLDIDGYCVEAPAADSSRGGRLPKQEIERLRALANDMANDVKKFKQSRVIGPYSPAERRIIHLELEADPEIETVSDAVADQFRGKRITIQLKDSVN